MTEKKRYTYIDISNNDTIGSFFCNGTHLSNQKVVELLNENEQLKQAYTQLKHRHSLLHDVCIDAECDRDSYCKDVVSLEKENKRLIKMLDNVANYMQKQHKEVPIDDFVEWWNKIVIGDKYE